MITCHSGDAKIIMSSVVCPLQYGRGSQGSRDRDVGVSWGNWGGGGGEGRVKGVYAADRLLTAQHLRHYLYTCIECKLDIERQRLHILCWQCTQCCSVVPNLWRLTCVKSTQL